MSAKKLMEKMVGEDAFFEELQAGSVTLVRMVRDPVYGPPHVADVHPDEVERWAELGWERI